MIVRAGFLRRAATAGAGLMLCLTLTACAALLPRPPGPETAPAVWQAFREREERLAGNPADFFIKASLYYTTKERSNRTVLSFWGRLGDAYRLDVQAGVGSMLAMYREDAGHWLAFYPQDKKAYDHEDPRRALPALGVNIPFSLSDLCALMTGRLGALVPKSYRRAEARPNGLAFIFGPGARLTELTLDRLGRPVALAGGGTDGTRPFTVALSGYAGAPDDPADLADRMDMAIPPDETANLLVKNLDYKSEPWPASALDLPLPPGIETLHLAP
jgi:hypothetical protein